MSNFTVDELKKLTERVLADPLTVDDLTPEEVVGLRKHMNPLGNIIMTKQLHAVLSIINWRDLYLRRIHMTSLVGFLYRLASEFVPTDELEQEKVRYDAECTKIKGGWDAGECAAALETAATVHKSRNELITSTAKGFILKFLNRNFKYDPDRHVRAAASDKKDDPDKPDRDDMIRKRCATEEKASEIEAKLVNKPEMVFNYVKSGLVGLRAGLTETTDQLSKLLGILEPLTSLFAGTEVAPAIDDAIGLISKKFTQIKAARDDVKVLADPFAAADSAAMLKVTPSADVFYNWGRYLDNHYEEVRDTVSALYSEKPDLEFSVILYDAFKTPEAAKSFLQQHANEFKWGVEHIQNNAVCLLGPFKENRHRVDYYNKNTEVLKMMHDQQEADHKLGKDIMEKQVRVKKRKNIEEAGPDAPGLAAYSRAMNVMSELGSKKIISVDEMRELENAKSTVEKIREDYEVPDDAIQVDVFAPVTGPDGTISLAKNKFYTQAEAPLHMQEGSEYAEIYQPKRTNGQSVTESTHTKTIVSKTGQTRTIVVRGNGDDIDDELEGSK